MAIGTARMLGFHLNRNFYMPYISTSLTEFWQRWHISLSTWLRDYLYIPLGGNRRGQRRTYVNLMITMLLGGLWHGASWNFVIWGGAHGLGLAANRYWGKTFKAKPTPIGRFVAWFFTFLFVCVIWVLFRAPDTATMWPPSTARCCSSMPRGATWYYTWFFIAAAAMVIGHLIGMRRTEEDLIFFRSPFSARVAFAMAAVLLTSTSLRQRTRIRLFTFSSRRRRPALDELEMKNRASS